MDQTTNPKAPTIDESLVLDGRSDRYEFVDRLIAEGSTIAQLVERGDFVGPMPFGSIQAVHSAIHELKQHRVRQGLSLADVSARSGMDKSQISKLEGHPANPTLLTLARYAAALGKSIHLTFEDIDPAPAPSPENVGEAT